MSESDHNRLADELERETDALEHDSQELERRAEETRADWERKRRDPNVPGAPEPEGAGEDAPEETETPPW